MVWREKKDYVTDCYSYLTNVQGHSHKTRKNIQYQDLPSAIRPVQHSVDLPIQMPPASLRILDKESSTCFESSGADFEPCQTKGILNTTGHRNTADVTSLLRWTLHHLNQAYKLLQSRRVLTVTTLSWVRTNHGPVLKHKPNKCNMPLSEVHMNATMQGPHYVLKDGQWATAHMSKHPKVQLTISVDCAHAHGESLSALAINVNVIADAQVNVSSG